MMVALLLHVGKLVSEPVLFANHCMYVSAAKSTLALLGAAPGSTHAT